MRIAIVDDEVHCIEILVIHLQANFPDANIVYKSNKVEEALETLPKLDIDLLFLDIEMPGMSGFHLLEQLPDYQFDVIFTTAYSQYALQAFKIRAINYLMKPVDETELLEAISIYRENKGDHDFPTADKVEALLSELKKDGFIKSKISVPVSDGYEFIEVNDIMYCKSQSNYTTLYLADESEILVCKTLKEVAATLEQYFFMRVHHSYLINPNYMKNFSRNDGGYLVMEDKKQIPVSKANKNLVTGLFDTVRKTPGE